MTDADRPVCRIQISVRIGTYVLYIPAASEDDAAGLARSCFDERGNLDRARLAAIGGREQ
ncbi:MAG TPA: hypothetical protein VF194_06275 [Ferrovibrio sp.]|uniref:hypothetical protein n=1 Tax=Ferrovibrio sp. TaxID=1917215 RepID=UPI002ED686F1